MDLGTWVLIHLLPTSVSVGSRQKTKKSWRVGWVGETEGDKIRRQIKTCLKEARVLAREKWRDWG